MIPSISCFLKTACIRMEHVSSKPIVLGRTSFNAQHNRLSLRSWLQPANHLGLRRTTWNSHPVDSHSARCGGSCRNRAAKLGDITDLCCLCRGDSRPDLVSVGTQQRSQDSQPPGKISLELASCVRRTAGIYRKQGARSLLLAKFVPGLNTVSPPLAGIIKMRLRRFLLFDVRNAGLGECFPGNGLFIQRRNRARGRANCGVRGKTGASAERWAGRLHSVQIRGAPEIHQTITYRPDRRGRT